MRFVRAGAPFCQIGARADTPVVGDYYTGQPFYPTVAEITPPTYTIARVPVRQGQPFNWSSPRKDASYGVANQGQPFYVYTGTHNYVAYTKNPVRQGQPFNWSSPHKDASYGVANQGQPFYVYTGTHSYPTYLKLPVRRGAPWNDMTTRSDIDASNGRYAKGAPFYVPFTGTVVITYNATRMFLLF